LSRRTGKSSKILSGNAPLPGWPSWLPVLDEAAYEAQAWLGTVINGGATCLGAASRSAPELEGIAHVLMRKAPHQGMERGQSRGKAARGKGA